MGTETPTPASVDMDALLAARGETAKPKAERFLVRLPHPEEKAIVAALDSLESGETENAGEVLADIRRRLTTNGIAVSYSTTKLDRDTGRVTDERILVDGKEVVSAGVFMIYLKMPDPTAELQGQVYKSFGPNSGRNRRGWNPTFLEIVNQQFRTAIGSTAGQATADSVPDGDEDVLPS